MFETWTHKQKKSHTLHEWKVPVFSRAHIILDIHFLEPNFAFFVSQSKAYLVLNGLLHFLPDQFRQHNSLVMKVHHHTSVFVLFHVDPMLKINLCQVHCNTEGSRNLTGDICFHHSILSIILMSCSKSPLSLLLTSNVALC